MATTTTNYGLTKPDYNESADIAVINSNMDIIDTKMKEIESAGGGGASAWSDISDKPFESIGNGLEVDENGVMSATGGTEIDDIKSNLSNSADWLNGGNIFDESKEIKYSGIKNNNGVFENELTDGRTYFDFELQLYYENSYVKPSGTKQINTEGIYSITIDTTNYEFNYLRIKHNGLTNDLFVNYPFNKKGIYTFSFEVLSANPAVIGGLKFKNITINEGNKALPFAQYSKSNVELTGEVAELQRDKVSNSVVSDAWNSTATYSVGQYCIYNNSLWKCLVQHNGQVPTEGTYWTKLSIASELQALWNAIVQEREDNK